MGEFLLQVLIELGLYLGPPAIGEGIARAYRRSTTHPVVWTLGLFGVGAFIGWLSANAVPDRVSPVVGFRGISLVVAPLVVGALMYAWGRYRKRRELPFTGFATFHGGAAFALGVALARLSGTG